MLDDFKLRVFMEVASCGSFTIAAGKLGVSQPAVSQSISTLEKMLGVQLLERTRGEALLTSAGRAFMDYAEKILYWYDAASDMFGSAGRLSVNHPVRIAVDEPISSFLLPRALVTLSAAHPEIAFEIVRKGGEALPSDVFEIDRQYDESVPGTHFGRPEDADVEITASPSPETMDFEGEGKLIGVMEAVLVTSPLNRALAGSVRGDAKPFSTLAGVHVSNSFAVWEGYRPFLTPDIVARVSVESYSVESVKYVVKSSPVPLVGILPALSVRDELMSGALVKLPVQLPRYSFDIHFNPLPEFAEKEVCKLLRQALVTAL